MTPLGVASLESQQEASALAARRCRSVPLVVVLGVIALAVFGALGGVFGGPALGDHEAIVAQGARDMRLSGDWLVPRFLDTAFIRKPPLPNWLVAGASYLFGNDPATGLPITTAVARLPSALAALGTVLLLWRLASAMFGPRTGLITGGLASSSVFILLYGPNATVEMLLTFCCTWAYLHFWSAMTAQAAGRRRLHFFLFYLAMGLGMMAKGPAPIAMVAVPLFVWWYLDHPLRVLSRLRANGLRPAVACGLRGLWPRTKAAFTQTWLLPGLLVFAAVFVPWMVAVADRHPQAWNLWNWQYLQRAQGQYEDTRDRGMFYYVPIVIGCVTPWLFLLAEALAAPWLARYARQRRALFYVGVWAVMGVVVMSFMEFKKPYYVIPALPGLVLLMGVVADRFYSRPLEFLRRRARLTWGLVALALAAGCGFGWYWARENLPDVSTALGVISAATAAGLLIATALYLSGRGWAAMGLTAVSAVASFQLVWHLCGSALDNADRVAKLAQALDEHQVPPNARLLWADQRPDARLSFYFNRRSGHMLPAEEIVQNVINRSGKPGKDAVQKLALDRAEQLLKGAEPVYLILERRHFEQWKMVMGDLGRLVVAVNTDPNSEAKDWVLVTNGV